MSDVASSLMVAGSIRTTKPPGRRARSAIGASGDPAWLVTAVAAVALGVGWIRRVHPADAARAVELAAEPDLVIGAHGDVQWLHEVRRNVELLDQRRIPGRDPPDLVAAFSVNQSFRRPARGRCPASTLAVGFDPSTHSGQDRGAGGGRQQRATGAAAALSQCFIQRFVHEFIGASRSPRGGPGGPPTCGSLSVLPWSAQTAASGRRA